MFRFCNRKACSACLPSAAAACCPGQQSMTKVTPPRARWHAPFVQRRSCRGRNRYVRFCTAEMSANDMASRQIAEKLLAFINASDTQFHAVFEASKKLVSAGFTQLSERQPWKIEAGGKYFFTRNARLVILLLFAPGRGTFLVAIQTCRNYCVMQYVEELYAWKVSDPAGVQFLGCLCCWRAVSTWGWVLHGRRTHRQVLQTPACWDLQPLWLP